MRNVMMKAQELGMAILESELYKRSKELEEKMMADPEASQLLSNYMEKQNKVNEVLGDQMDPEVLAAIGEELEAARDALNGNELIKAAQEANKACNDMMDNVNRILQLIVNGQTEDGGCTGNCGTCGGCH